MREAVEENDGKRGDDIYLWSRGSDRLHDQWNQLSVPEKPVWRCNRNLQ